MGTDSFNNSADKQAGAKAIYAEQETALREQISQDPGNNRPHVTLVHNLVGQGKTAQALEHARSRMLQLDSPKDFVPPYIFAVREHVKSINEPALALKALDDELAFVTFDAEVGKTCVKSMQDMRSEQDAWRQNLAASRNDEPSFSKMMIA